MLLHKVVSSFSHRRRAVTALDHRMEKGKRQMVTMGEIIFVLVMVALLVQSVTMSATVCLHVAPDSDDLAASKTSAITLFIPIFLLLAKFLSKTLCSTLLLWFFIAQILLSALPGVNGAEYLVCIVGTSKLISNNNFFSAPLEFHLEQEKPLLVRRTTILFTRLSSLAIEGACLVASLGVYNFNFSLFIKLSSSVRNFSCTQVPETTAATPATTTSSLEPHVKEADEKGTGFDVVLLIPILLSVLLVVLILVKTLHAF